MKNIFSTSILTLTLLLTLTSLFAQNDTMYIMKQGAIWGKYKVSHVDSVIFYNPIISPSPINITYVNIPSGTFTMGSPASEANRDIDEVEHQVTLSAFRISKYEITNTQYAAFLNAKSIGSNGKYAAGAYPTQPLIFANTTYNWGLTYNGTQWVPVPGYENYPVIYVTWYGATEFATYAGGTLPTEAQWEYACRGNEATAFNTGACLSDAQSNYNWRFPQSSCTNTNTTYPGKTQSVGIYPANAYGLHDMHGNVWEWCSDWYGDYETTAQTNPTGAVSGPGRVSRSGSWVNDAQGCRSADRGYYLPAEGHNNLGLRVVLAP